MRHGLGKYCYDMLRVHPCKLCTCIHADEGHSNTYPIHVLKVDGAKVNEKVNETATIRFDNLHTMTEIELKGQTLLLHAYNAIWWPAQSMLIVADTHFSKDTIFRNHGIAIPKGTNQYDLHRLQQLVTETKAKQIYILGDFTHGKMHANDPFITEFSQWKAALPELELAIVAGNHDKYLRRDLLSDIDWYADYTIGPFSFHHEPSVQTDSYVLCGHLHPKYTLRNLHREKISSPVFWFTPDYAVLPSFGSMTGGYTVKPQPGDSLYLSGETSVIKVF